MRILELGQPIAKYGQISLYTHICVGLIFFIFSRRGRGVCQRGSQDLRHGQIWANQDNFWCSSPISVRRTLAIFIFLKLRKLASMFLVFARISSDFGLNSKKFGYICKKTAKNLHVLSKKTRITLVGCMHQIFDNFGAN